MCTLIFQDLLVEFVLLLIVEFKDTGERMTGLVLHSPLLLLLGFQKRVKLEHLTILRFKLLTCLITYMHHIFIFCRIYGLIQDRGTGRIN